MRPDGPRDPVAGPDSGPTPPFPVKLQGPVIKGFGRGSKELGIPTANIPPGGLSAYPSLDTGVYYGFVGLQIDEKCRPCKGEAKVYEAVLSIGFNPFYGNRERSIEIHILHTFPTDFYGEALNLLILGFIRPEYDYVSRDALIDDIRTDCEVARQSLGREGYQNYQQEGGSDGGWLREFGWAEKGKEGEGEGT